jgi:hypothetical protein
MERNIDMTDLLQEYCDSRGLALRVDRHAGIIRGIKILGPHSRNGRDYLPDALARAVGLYEGAKVNVNHPKGHPLAPRDYQERIGVMRNVAHRTGEGLFADFHFNPKHYLSEQLVWDAEHAPENVGFSHNVQARTRRQGEATLVEEIVQVHSVDLVADPATTRGLFEEFPADGPAVVDAEAIENNAAAPPSAKDNFAMHTDPPETAPGPAVLCEQQSEITNELCEQQAAEIANLRLEVDRLRAKEAAEQRRATVRALLAEYRLPDPEATDPATKAIVSDAFVQSLLSASDAQAMRRLVEERAALVGDARLWRHERTQYRRPVSRDQITLDPQTVIDGRSFARAITV